MNDYWVIILTLLFEVSKFGEILHVVSSDYFFLGLGVFFLLTHGIETILVFFYRLSNKNLVLIRVE